ncbi:MAG: hypothetical protein ABR538_10180 [Candidatus Binatia bacterium]
MIARGLLCLGLAAVAPLWSPAAAQAGPADAVEMPAPLSPTPAPPFPNPFGPAYDPTRPPPEEPKDAGPGIVAATLIASGIVAIEEMPVADPTASPFFGVALEVEVAAASTTPVLGPSTVSVRPEEGSDLPLAVACTPTMDDPDGRWRADDSTVAAWNIQVDNHSWYCGGRSARMAVRVGPGGLRLRTPPGSSWKGPLLLLFARLGGETPRRVVLPGAAVELPAPPKSDDAGR